MLLQSLLRRFAHQKWIRFGIRDRVLRIFDNIDEPRPSRSFTVPFFSRVYKGNLADFIDWHTYYYGAYCGEELALIRDALADIPDPVVLDIGANVGHHALFASTLAKEVHAFEPFPKVIARIHEKIKINSIDNITVHEVGLGETNEELPYLPPHESNTGTGSFVSNSNTTASPITLPIRIGDEYLKSYNLKKIDFIKIDIEGFEPQALRGLRNTICLHRPVVFLEWSANERALDIELNSLFPQEYTIYSFNADRAFLGLFNKQKYILVKDKGACCDGNKIAIPNEKVNNLAAIKRKIRQQ